MTKNEIIEIATKVYGECDWHESALHHLKAFAKLVEQRKVNQIADACAKLPFGDTADSFAIWIREQG